MPRLMSFALTTRQFKDRTKTVTRRLGWLHLRAGDIIEGVEKAQGLKKGEQVKYLGRIRITSTRREPLDAITADDVRREGFPGWSPERFIAFFTKSHKCTRDRHVHRIEFEYLQRT